ncbi:hypothetical protein J6590_092051 [Homalodisca vitripennis]|nr:hypothetical protein J6590_092051 [Homalodisca vitripennis]
MGHRGLCVVTSLFLVAVNSDVDRDPETDVVVPSDCTPGGVQPGGLHILVSHKHMVQGGRAVPEILLDL